MTNAVIYWYRQDLRTRDLPGLCAAVAGAKTVIPCYIHDPAAAGKWAPGGASCWWLHHSLAALEHSLAQLGSKLLIFEGATAELLPRLARELGAEAIYCTRRHEPWAAAQEAGLQATLASAGVALKRYPGALMLEPERVSNQAGLPFKVFTPFWKTCRGHIHDASPLPAPNGFRVTSPPAFALHLDTLQLQPGTPDWAASWSDLWQPGEAGAWRALKRFFNAGIAAYTEGRDFPDCDVTSRLSAHLHHGEISPRQLWATGMAHQASQPQQAAQVDKFLSELGWREFSYHLLHHFPQLPDRNFKPAFDAFPWLGSAPALVAWQRGQTGYPLVDAGMRELWATGYMHNRVRMIAASFLTKHLLVPWQRGAAWFWDTLVDADLANNSCSWQWVAGSGADAAPFFRIFNPILQGRKFDPAGHYIRRWVPEIATLPDRFISQPDGAPAQVLEAAGVVLGSTYPRPIVVHEDARQTALAAWEAVRASTGSQG